MDDTTTYVIGGGLAGLTAAATLARKGVPVTVLESATTVGGRARSYHREGFTMNVGPHALYREGGGRRLLAELGVIARGRRPRIQRAGVLVGGSVEPAVRHLRRLAGGRAHLLRLLAGCGERAASELAGTTAGDWLAGELDDDDARSAAASVVRTATYACDLDLLDAGAAARQLRRAAHGVLYLHGGWASLVSDLADAVLAAGGTIMTGMTATAVEHDDAGVHAVRLADGSCRRASAVVVAVPDARRATNLLEGPGAARLADAAGATVPIRMAHLDVALRPLPSTRHPNVLGIDDAVYLAVQSDVADVAPADGAVVTVGRYLRPDEENLDHRPALEHALDVAQPGWRDHVIDARYVPRSMVAGDHPRPATAGTRWRATVDAPGVPGLAVAGDWVGPDGVLADAAISSGGAAACAVLHAPIASHGAVR